MNQPTLKDWLHASDDAAPAPVMPQLTAEGLLDLVARRRVKRRGLAAASAATAVVAVAVLTLVAGRTETAMRPVASHRPDVEISQEQLATLRQEIDRRRALVAALRQADDLERLNRELAKLEAEVPTSLARTLIRFEDTRSQAAAVSLYYANALAADFGEEELAAAEYRTIVSRYPGTPWSAAAEQALSPPAGRL